MEDSVILYGGSGHCKVIIDILQNATIIIDCVLDDNATSETILGCKIFNASAFALDEKSNLILSIGNNKVRKALSQKLKVNYTKALHPKAIISKFASIDVGTVVMAGAIINPDVKIGKHCIINSGAIIEHDCFIDDFVHISPNASLAGNVTVGEGTHFGIGAVVIQGIKIGKWATIGAGTVIIKDIPDFAVVVGNPAKVIKFIYP